MLTFINMFPKFIDSSFNQIVFVLEKYNLKRRFTAQLTALNSVRKLDFIQVGRDKDS